MDSVGPEVAVACRDVGIIGHQLYVSHRGEVLVDSASGVDGLGHQLVPQSVLPLFCAMKPILALRVVDSLASDVDTAVVGDLASMPAPIGRIKVADLMSHSAGLPRPSGRQMLLSPSDRRLEQIAYFMKSIPPDEYWSAYSEAAAWYILRECLTSITGDRHDASIASDECSYLSAPGTNLDLRPLGEVHPKYGLRPMLGATDETFFRSDNPGFGGCASARWLGSWAERSLFTDLGVEMSRPRRVWSYDHVLKRDCSFGLGLMVHLEGHGFGSSLSTAAVGHSGYRGQSFFLADPQSQLVVSFAAASVTGDDRMVNDLRSKIVDLVTTSIGRQ